MSIEKIADRLKEARKSRGLQQKYLAEKLGISRAGYSRIETGNVEITTKNLVKITEILDVSLD
jgi:transcriptional regulator with XRE-family HTH domain